MLRSTTSLLLLFFCLMAFGQNPNQIAIVGARVIDGSGSPAHVESVLLRDGRIAAVSDHLQIPDGTRVIHADGQTLLPGLFDLHTHLNSSAGDGLDDIGKNLKAYLLCGVTTVNDFSSYGEMLDPLRTLLHNGILVGPKVNFAIRFSTPGGHGTEFGWGDFFTQAVSTPEEAHAAMRSILPYKPDVIKVFTDGWRYDRAPDLSSMNLETLTAIVQDAHRAGIRVFTHTVTLRGAKIAARAGVDVLAHGVGDAPVDNELIALMKQSGTGYVSTLATYEPRSLRKPASRLMAVLPFREEKSQDFVSPTKMLQPDDPQMKRWHYLEENVHRLSAEGIPIGVGTDAGVTGTYHGWAALHELELLVDSGLSPLQAITAGTSTSARLTGKDSDRGLIQPGKIADLLLVKGNPDQRIQDIENTSAVFVEGKEQDLQKLEAAVHSTEVTPLPSHAIPNLVDNFEQEDGRTNLDTMLIDNTDRGPDHSRILFARTLRSPDDHAVSILAKMGPKQAPFADLEVPLTKGEVSLADASRYTGISFDVRGDGEYRLRIDSYGLPKSEWYSSSFQGESLWKTIRIPFSDLRSAQSSAPLDLRSLRALEFGLLRTPGSDAWLELDNIRFY